MVNDNQRREAANNIRCFLLAPQNECIWDIDGLQTIGRLVGTPLGESVLLRLADLIDRPTCRNVSGYKDTFECSECRLKVDIVGDEGNEYGEVFSTPFIPHFCPNCGALLVNP